MREPPKLPTAAIAAALRAHYGVTAAAVTFLPIGNDSASSAYRADAADGAAYFLKVRTGAGFSEASLAVPRFLLDLGVPHILAPLPAADQGLWVRVDGFAMSVYPFVDGRVGADAGLSERHWRALGAMLRQAHACRLPPDLLPIMPREAFIPKQRDLIERLEAAVTRTDLVDLAQRELAAFWRARRDDIRLVVARADVLGRRLRQAPAPPLVVCHADLHTWNVLLGANDVLWVVDWDETILALKERDLMFLVGGIGGGQAKPQETAWFLQGYGETAIDPVALAYYRYAWAVQDMAAYGEQVFFMPDQGAESRRDGARGFIGQFGPGNIVELALGSEVAAD
jgi:spectinomycin phosphotransferase